MTTESAEATTTEMNTTGPEAAGNRYSDTTDTNKTGRKPAKTIRPLSLELESIISRISYHLDPKRIGTAAIADIRRISRDELPTAFWRRYMADVEADWREPRDEPDSRVDAAWGRLMQAMAEMSPGPHRPSKPFGRALSNTGYSEDRLSRLLSANGSALAREVRVAGQWLHRKGIRYVDWEAPAHLLLSRPWIGLPVHDNKAADRIASDYFRTNARRHAAAAAKTQDTE